jgi:hypothetical protein
VEGDVDEDAEADDDGELAPKGSQVTTHCCGPTSSRSPGRGREPENYRLGVPIFYRDFILQTRGRVRELLFDLKKISYTKLDQMLFFVSLPSKGSFFKTDFCAYGKSWRLGMKLAPPLRTHQSRAWAPTSCLAFL